jgi:hypothetical protein
MAHMMEIASSRRIGLGLRKHGFKCGSVIFGEVMADAPKRGPNRASNSSNANGDVMRVAVISWHLFWGASDKQDLACLDKWLGRWVFADDGVRLSMRPTTQEGLASSGLVRTAGAN